jgi:anti-sigma B factor antagonist
VVVGVLEDGPADAGGYLVVEQHADGDGIVWLAPAGEIDTSTAHILADAIAAVPSTAAVVVVDLARVMFLGSAGISTLVVGWRTATDAGRRFTVVNPRPVVRRILEITAVWSLLSGQQSPPATTAS